MSHRRREKSGAGALLRRCEQRSPRSRGFQEIRIGRWKPTACCKFDTFCRGFKRQVLDIMATKSLRSIPSFAPLWPIAPSPIRPHRIAVSRMRARIAFQVSFGAPGRGQVASLCPSAPPSKKETAGRASPQKSVILEPKSPFAPKKRQGAPLNPSLPFGKHFTLLLIVV